MNNNKVKHATVDLSEITMFASFWYIPIFTVIYLGIFIVFGSTELDNLSYLSMGINANRVFMLVMGIIIGGAFIKWAIGLGITRSQFYKANMFSGAVMAVALNLVMLIIGMLIGLLPFAGSENIDQALNMNPVMNLLTLTLMVYLGYLAGTLIGVGFYRNGWLGALAILITIICSSLPEALDSFIVGMLGTTEGVGTLIVTSTLIVGLIIINYYFIKQIVIKF